MPKLPKSKLDQVRSRWLEFFDPNGADPGGNAAKGEVFAMAFEALPNAKVSPLDESNHETAVSVSITPAANTDLKQEERALALLVAHPEWSVKDITDAVPCHRTSVYRWRRFMAAREALESGRYGMPRGSKDAETGSLEAWE